MPLDSLKNIGRLDMFGITDYAKKRKEASEKEASANRPERSAALNAAADAQRVAYARARGADVTESSADAMGRIASEGEERRKKILSRFGEKEE